MRYIVAAFSLVFVTALLSSSSLAFAERLPKKIHDQVEIWYEYQEQCRGGSGDDPRTNHACEARSKQRKKLYDMGYCFGHEEDSGTSEYIWHRCTKGSFDYTGGSPGAGVPGGTNK